MIRAKMRVSKATQFGTTSTREEILMYAVFENSGPNKEWAQATPAGTLMLTIDNPGAQGKLKEGQEYFVDITPA